MRLKKNELAGIRSDVLKTIFFDGGGAFCKYVREFRPNRHVNLFPFHVFCHSHIILGPSPFIPFSTPHWLYVATISTIDFSRDILKNYYRLMQPRFN